MKLSVALAGALALACGSAYAQSIANVPYAGSPGTGAPSTADQIVVHQGVAPGNSGGNAARMTLQTLQGLIGGLPLSGGTLTGPLTAPGITSTGNASVAGTLGVTGAVTVTSGSITGLSNLTVTSGSANASIGGTLSAGGVWGNNLYGGRGRTINWATTQAAPYDFGLDVAANTSGSLTSSGSVASVTVPSDAAAVIGGTIGVNYLSITGNTAAGFEGNRTALNVILNIPASNGTVPNDSSRQHNAGLFTVQISANQGGTAPHSGSSAGFIYGLSSQTWCNSGATDLSGCIGGERDVGLYGTASAAQRTGLQIISTGDTEGNDFDIGLRVGRGSGTGGALAPGWKIALGLGGPGGVNPVDPSGAILKYVPPISGAEASAAPISAAQGIDVSGYIFSDAAFRSPGGFSVDGSAGVTDGPMRISASSTAASIDVWGATLASVAPNTTGNGYLAHDQVYDPATGTILTASTVNGGGTPTAYTANVLGGFYGASPPATGTMIGGNGSSLTAAYTWNTVRTLKLQPSGGAIQLGSGAFSANGTTAVSLGSVAPAGAHATVQEWLTITDASGTVRYIPAF